MIGNTNCTERIFRGKRINNGEWVYGAYFTMHHNDNREHIHHFIIPDDTNISIGTPIEKIQVEVISETVGQYTGVNDINNTPIYEDDLVETFQIYMSYQQVGNYPPPNIEVEEWDIKRSVHEVEFSYGSFNINGFPIMFEHMGSDTESYEDSYEKHQFECLWVDNTFDVQTKYPYLSWNYFKKPHIIGNKHDNPELLEEDENNC